MSTPSDNQTPSLNGDSASQAIEPTWDALVARVQGGEASDLESFERWLDQDLAAMEAELDQFASNNSRYRGRR